MENINNFELSLNRLEDLERKKFSFEEFNVTLNSLRTELDNIKLLNEQSSSVITSDNDKTYLKKIINKIEILEARIAPKADLLKSFSESKL